MGDALLTAVVIGITMWVLLLVLYFVLGLIMTGVKNIGKAEKKFYNIELFRYDRVPTREYDSFGKMMLAGLKMCSEITLFAFIIILIICILVTITE